MSEIKTLFTQSLHYLTGRTMIMITGFISFPILTRIFSVSDYGLLSLINTTLFLAIVLGKLGLPSSVVRFYAEFKSAKKLDDFYSTVLVTSLISAATFAGLFFVSAQILLRHRITDYLFDVLTLASILVFIGCVTDVLLNFQRAEQRTRLFNSINVLRRYTSLGFSIFFALFLIKGLYGFYVGRIIAGSVLLGALLLFFFTNRRIRSLKFSTAVFKPSIKYGFPIIWAELGHNLLNYADRYLIQFYLGSASLGLYTAGYNLTTYVTEMMIYPISYAITPIYMNILISKGINQTKTFFTQLFRYLNLCLFPLAFGFIALREDLISFLASAKFSDASTIIPYVMLGQAIYTLQVVLNSGLFITKRTYIVTCLMIAACTVNVLLNIILIPIHGIVGAAMATLITYILYSFAITYFSFKVFSFTLPYVHMLIYFCSAAVMFFIVNMISAHSPLQNMLFKIPSGIVVYSFSVLLFDSDIRANLYRHFTAVTSGHRISKS